MSSGPYSGKRAKPNKLGRNEPCFCGSGVKYKKCCLLKGLTPPVVPRIPIEVIDEHQQSTQKRLLFLQSKGIYVSLPNTVTFKEKSFLAVGNKIMWDDNPHATFHQLILSNLSKTLGKEWWDAETAKPLEEKHFIKRCYEELAESDSREDLDVTPVDEHTRTMLATGDTQALLSLAFDVWMLTHKGYMRDEWLGRLRGMGEYQSVRYEIGVASLFVRIGCELEFYNDDRIEEDGNPPKRAEFIAVHAATGNRVAVEAKSRHVDGVIHTPGTMNYRKALKGDISNLYRKALLKVTDGLPLLVFIDVNSPTETDQAVQNTQWFADVKRSFDSRPSSSPENPDKYAAIFITNYSSHYQGDNVSHSGQFMVIGGANSKYPLADDFEGEFMKRLLKATNSYGYVPPSLDNSKTGMYETEAIMSRNEFINKIKKLTMPQAGDPEYERRERESKRLVDMLVWDATQKSGGGWDGEVGAECYRQFEWLYKQP